MVSEWFQSGLKPCGFRVVSEWSKTVWFQSGFRVVLEWSETIFKSLRPKLSNVFFFLRLPNGQYGPVSQLSRSEKCCTGPFNWGEAHCAGEKVKRKIGPFQRKSL